MSVGRVGAVRAVRNVMSVVVCYLLGELCFMRVGPPSRYQRLDHVAAGQMEKYRLKHMKSYWESSIRVTLRILFGNIKYKIYERQKR
jgi:hypothetical protein